MKKYKFIIGALVIAVIGFLIYLTLNENKEVGDNKINDEIYLGASFYLKENEIIFDDEVISEADIETFEVLDDEFWAKDKNSVYYNSYGEGASVKKIEKASAETFRIINSEYVTDEKYIWSYGGGEPNLLEDVINVENFEVLDKYFSIYENDVYQANKKLEGANTKTFRYLQDCYATDGKSIWCRSNKIDNVDIETFKPLGGGFWCYAKDKSNVYKTSKIWKDFDFDVETFKFLKGDYLKDKNNVYYDDIREDPFIIKEADSETFEVLRYSWAKDKNNIYYDGKIMEYVDYETFEIVDFPYAKDKNEVYYYDTRLYSINPEQFVILDIDKRLVRDKNTCYESFDKVSLSKCKKFEK